MGKSNKKGNRKKHLKNRTRIADNKVGHNAHENSGTSIFDPDEMATTLVSFIATLELTSREAELTLSSAQRLGLETNVVEALSRLKKHVDKQVALMDLRKTFWPDRESTLEVARELVQEMREGILEEEDVRLKTSLTDILHSEPTYEDSLRAAHINVHDYIDQLMVWSFAMWGVRWNVRGAAERLLEYARDLWQTSQQSSKIIRINDYLPHAL